MANKVDVFTEELSKVFTILQQQYVMIKYMKTLITSGELDETEISKLKEQITLINTNIDTIMNDQIIPIKQNIERIEEGMSEFEKVMPTDINTDSNGNLILEHDGIEITGQKKQVAVYTKSQIDALINSAGLKTFNLNYPNTGMYPTANHAERTITNATQIPIVYACIQYVKEHGACILKIRNGMYTSSGYTDYNPVYVLCITSPDSDNSILECYGTTGEHIIKLISDNDTSLGSESNTKIIYDKIGKASDIKNVYRHQLTLHTDNGEYQELGLTVYSSSNLNVDSLQDLTTLLKPNSNTLYFAFVIHSTNIVTYKVVYDNNIWKMGYDDESTGKPDYVITSVSDIVTTI